MCGVGRVGRACVEHSGRGPQGAMALSRESARRWRSERVGGLRGDHSSYAGEIYTIHVHLSCFGVGL